jgi:hypothetical protein
MKSCLSGILLCCYLLANVGQVEHAHVCNSTDMQQAMNIEEAVDSCCATSEIAEDVADEEGCCKDKIQYKKIFAGKVQSAEPFASYYAILQDLIYYDFIIKQESVFYLAQIHVTLPLPHAPPPRGVPLYDWQRKWKIGVCLG